MSVEFERDAQKARSNLRKHGVDFADCVSVFFDDLAITINDSSSDEERFITIGADALERILVVVYTWRGERIRIISTRKATRRERKHYEG